MACAEKGVTEVNNCPMPRKVKNSEQNDIPEERFRANWDARKAFFVLLSLAGAAFVCFVLFIYLFAFYGGGFVDKLDEQIGEIVAQEALALEKSGQAIEAIDTYRQALQMSFDNPQERFWTLRQLGNLLINEGQNEEAVVELEKCVEGNVNDSLSASMLCGTYLKMERYEDALRVARGWLAAGKSQDIKESQASALYYIGRVYELTGRTEDALKTYQEGARLSPFSHNSYHAALMLSLRGKNEEALELLDAYMPGASSWQGKSAAVLRDRLRKGT